MTGDGYDFCDFCSGVLPKVFYMVHAGEEYDKGVGGVLPVVKLWCGECDLPTGAKVVTVWPPPIVP